MSLATTMENLAITGTDTAVLAASTIDLSDKLKQGAGPIPLGSHQAWMEIQEECEICLRFKELKRTGQIPGKKEPHRTVLNKLMKKCEIYKGLVVSRQFDDISRREVLRTLFPSSS